MKLLYLLENQNCTTRNCTFTTGTDLCDCLEFLDNQNFTLKLNKLTIDLASNMDDKIAIIYSSPAFVIASGLRTKIEPSVLLDLWLQQVKALIKFYKNNRTKCVLINVNTQKIDIESFVSKYSLIDKQINALQAVCDMPERSDIYTLASYQMIAQSSSIQRQCLELDAITLFSSNEQDNCDITIILSQFLIKEKNYKLEITRTRELLEKKQLTLESSTQDLELLAIDLQTEKEFAQKALTSHADALLEAQDISVKQLAENEKITEQLHSLQETLEGVHEKEQVSTKEHYALNNTIKNLENTLHTQSKQTEIISGQLQSEKSKGQKVNVIHAAALLEAQDISVKQLAENEKITEQLHSLQETLEEVHEKEQVSTKEHYALNNTIKNLENTLHTQCKRTEIISEQFEIEINLLSHEKIALVNEIDICKINQTWLIKNLLTTRKNLHSNSRTYRGLLKKQLALVRSSGKFDEKWYQEAYSDVSESEIEPIMHYLLYGVIEFRNPSGEFNTSNYLGVYVDVAHEGLNPLIHYIKFGQYEERKANPLQKRLPAPKG